MKNKKQFYLINDAFYGVYIGELEESDKSTYARDIADTVLGVVKITDVIKSKFHIRENDRFYVLHEYVVKKHSSIEKLKEYAMLEIL